MFLYLVYCPVAGGFLSFKPNIPKSLLLDGAHTVKSHFELVNYQVSSIYLVKLPVVFLLLMFACSFNLISCMELFS